MAQNDLSPGARLALGAALCVGGLAIGAYGLLDPAAEIQPDRFIAAPLGLVFFSAGALLALPNSSLRLRSLFGTLLITGFGVTTSWIAFGPGERRFGGSISLPFLSVRGASGELSGRIAFGIAAVLFDLLSLWSWIRLFRLLWLGPASSEPPDSLPQ